MSEVSILQETKPLITIKGTRKGLTLIMDDTCALDDALFELQNKLSEYQPKENEPVVPVTIKLGKRYMEKEHKTIISDVIEKQKWFSVQSFESDVISKEEAILLKEDSEVKVIHGMIRSGQVLEQKGDLLLIGDVNPGGEVRATGNIYIMGYLNGIAHAGTDGDKEAIIAASYMKPTQLRIDNYISRAPDYDSDGVYMECGYIDNQQDKIVIDRLQILSKKLQGFSRYERGIING